MRTAHARSTRVLARISIIVIVLAGGVMAGGPIRCVSGVVSAAEPHPNVLFLVADDLGWSDVGWHGGFGKTPNLDRLAREGLELDQHYVQPVCTPTRTALMSGRYPGRFGPHALSPSNLRAMPLGTVTLATALKSVGYETFQVGKWHLGARPEWGPNQFGFQHGYGTLTGAADPWTHKYRKGPYEDTWHRDGKFFDEEGNATELVAAEVVRRIEERKAPWFIYVGFHAVHTPVDAPDEYKRLYDGVKFHDDPEKHDSRMRLAAMVSQLDAKIGQFVAALERTGQRERTLIVFTSDNGGIESLKNAYVGKVGDSPLNSENDPLRGQKATLFEGGVRVCALANWPGVLKPRKHVTPMHAVDWFPTIASIVGYRSKADLKWDGVDQWAALTASSGDATSASGATNKRDNAETSRTSDKTGEGDGTNLRSIYIASSGGHMLRRGDWKLIVNKGGKSMLFNLARDPFEKTDLVKEEPARAAELRQLLEAQQALDAPKIPADLEGFPH